MGAGSPDPRDMIGLTLAVGGEPPASVAEICRAIDAARLPTTPWRAFRRPSTLWDGPGRELGAAGASYETGGGPRRWARLTLHDGPLRRRVIPLPVDTTPPRAPAPWRNLDLRPALTRSGHGRVRQIGPLPTSTVAVETVVWHQGDREWRWRLVVLSAEPDDGDRMLADAGALSAILPLRLVGEGTGLVADRRLSGGAPRSVKRQPTSMQTAETAADAFIIIGRSALRQMLGNLELLVDAPDPEAIHQLRVALRRLRAALSLFRGCLDTDRRLALAGRLKWASGILADVRDWDVFVAETLAPMAAALADDSALAAVGNRAAERRRAAQAGIARELHGARLNGALLELVRWFELPEAPFAGDRAGQPLRRFARRALRRGRRKLLGQYAAATPQSVDEWHALRILAKKLRYATDAFAPLYASVQVRPFREALHEVQDCLGRYNDAAASERLAAIAGDATATAMVAGWAARERLEQQRRFEGAWKKFRKCPPFWRKASG